MKDTERIYKLIARELTSENSTEDQENLYEEFLKSPEDEGKFLVIKEFWTKYFPKKHKHSIIEKAEKKLGFTYGPIIKTKNSFLLKYAAIFIFILSLSFSTYQLLKPKEKLVLNEYSSTAGEIKEIILSDGTKVWLNSKSFLIASEPFIGETREVKLFGEAYFEVAHNPDQPFIVKTPQLKTRVLGTHFSIIAYPTDEIQEIALHEGSVRLKAEGVKENKTELKPGERAYYSSKTGKINVVSTDLGEPAKWRDGILRFYDEDLFSITKKLERKFHTRIFITDSLVGNLRFSAEFDVESLESILDLLKEAHGFTYNKTENGILIQ